MLFEKFLASLYLSNKKDIKCLNNLINENIAVYIFISEKLNNEIILIIKSKFPISEDLLKIKINGLFKYFPKIKISGFENNILDILKENFNEKYNNYFIGDIKSIVSDDDEKKLEIFKFHINNNLFDIKKLINIDKEHYNNNITEYAKYMKDIFIIWISGTHSCKYNLIEKIINYIGIENVYMTSYYEKLKEYKLKECVIWDYDGKTHFKDLYSVLNKKGCYFDNIFFKPRLFIIISSISFKDIKKSSEYNKIINKIDITVVFSPKCFYGCVENCIHKPSNNSILQSINYSFDKLKNLL